MLEHRAMVVACLGLTVGACLGTSPEEQADEALGVADDGDPFHRPGQPCLVCHNESYSPGEDVFVVAGTIFERATDPNSFGLEGATVHVEDAEGRSFDALTNRAGNFMVYHRSGLDAPRQRSEGRLDIPWKPEYPLTVVVSYGALEEEMETQIWREGSCAGCHRGSEAGTDHVEKVWVEEVIP